MKMTRQDINKNTSLSADMVQEICTNAHIEGRKDMATLLSSRLDHMATRASIDQLSAVEIIDLLRHESESIDPKGGALWQ